MPQHGYYAHGQWNAQCDQCGRVFKSGQLSERWDKAKVCNDCWEPRHPQDFVKGVPDNPSVPWARPWVPVYVGAGGSTGLGIGALGGTVDGGATSL